MEKVSAFKCPGGILEADAKRAYAWKLTDMSKKKVGYSSPIEMVGFTSALWIFENLEAVKELIAEFESEE